MFSGSFSVCSRLFVKEYKILCQVSKVWEKVWKNIFKLCKIMIVYH